MVVGNTGMQMGGWFNKEINSLQDLQGLKIRTPGLGGEVQWPPAVLIRIVVGGLCPPPRRCQEEVLRHREMAIERGEEEGSPSGVIGRGGLRPPRCQVLRNRELAGLGGEV